MLARGLVCSPSCVCVPLPVCAADYIQAYCHTCRHCVVGDTLISTGSNTSVQVDRLEETADLLAYSQADGLVVRSATAVFSLGEKPIVGVALLDGRILSCTPDHKILRSDGMWIPAADLTAKDYVTVGYRPPVDAPREDSIRASTWSHQLAGLNLTLDLQANRARTLAFFRLLGYLCTDGAVGEHRCSLLLGHELDVASVQRDHVLVTGGRATVAQVKNSWRLDLAAPLTQSVLALGLIVGKRGMQPMPTILTATELVADAISLCPLPMVCAFLSGLFGAAGTTLSVKHGSIHGVGFPLSEAGPLLQSELGGLLSRCGFTADELTWTLSSATAGRLDFSGAYATTQRFAQQVGFAHCCHKQMRLEAGLAVLGSLNDLEVQRQRVADEFARVTAASSGFGQFAAARFEQAKENVDHEYPLHPSVKAWAPNTKRLLATGLKSLGTPSHAAQQQQVSVETLLTQFDAAKFFQDRDQQEGDADDAAHDVVPRGAKGMPTFVMPVLGVRARTVPCKVYDVTVPVLHADGDEATEERQEAEASFLADGIVVHSQWRRRTHTDVARGNLLRSS